MNLIKKLSPALTTILIVTASYVLVFIMLAATISPERYDISAGEVSPITITATKDVEDTLTTDRLIEAAARSVQPSYISDATVQPAVLAALQEAFDRLLDYRARTLPVAVSQAVSDSARLEARHAMPAGEISDETIDALARIGAGTLTTLYERTFALVRDLLSVRLSQGQEEEAILDLKHDLVAEGFADRDADIAVALARYTLRPNMLLDEETTEANRQKEREKVERIIYKKGQNIVRAGEVVTQSQIAMLDDMGMLIDKRVDVTLFLGLGALLLMLLLVLICYMLAFLPAEKRNVRMVSLLSLVIVVTVALCMLVRTGVPYLMPVALGAMLVTLLISADLAIMVNVVLSVIAGLLASMDSGAFTSAMFSMMLISIISGSLCIPLLKRKPHLLMILLAGLLVGASNMIATLAAGLIGSASQMGVLPGALWSAGGGLLSAALCILFQLALEWLFNLVTVSKLMELANPNRPLLRRLLLEAPGTYHHSILVANLAEAAANAIGADGLLARVGSYYHDVGKLKRPLYFKENQINDNPHDRTDPRVSTAILTSHPRDGVEMGQRARLPDAVLSIIAEHHGDTPVLFFYDKAVKQGGDVDLNGFRYESPRPRSREAAIVMLADTVEAAVRALAEPTHEKVAQLIQRLVRSKMEDGQLDECTLTFADLNLICESFAMVLNGAYHERVEYPNIALPERVKAEKQAMSAPDAAPPQGATGEAAAAEGESPCQSS